MYHSQSNSSFSMLFSMSNNGVDGANNYNDDGEMYSSTSQYSSYSSVDCTLSLGTPSTRLSSTNDHEKRRSSFGWNILPSTKHTQQPKPSAAKSHRAGTNGNGGDPLLARRCANCDTTSTPLWRNGPRGPKSLCNACGIRYKKEERRAVAAAASTNGGGAHMAAVDHSQYVINNNSSWSIHQQPQKMPNCYSSSSSSNNINDYQYVEEYDHHRDVSETTGIQFMSWLST